LYICVAVNSAWLNIELIYCNLKLQDPTEKHFGDVGILDKYEDDNNNNNNNNNRDLQAYPGILAFEKCSFYVVSKTVETRVNWLLR
jgi:hypothetical protein